FLFHLEVGRFEQRTVASVRGSREDEDERERSGSRSGAHPPERTRTDASGRAVLALPRTGPQASRQPSESARFRDGGRVTGRTSIEEHLRMNLAEYIASVSNAASTILEGMAVTFSHLFREPITIQYPDKTDRPVVDMLPPRYRGLLEVQMDICTGCKRCERACPIEVIAIDLTKDPVSKKQMMSRFDIDMGKCMFCGLCVEACNKEST